MTAEACRAPGNFLSSATSSIGIGDQVDLVEDGDDRLVAGTEFLEDFQRGVVEALDFRRGGVEHVDEEIREHGFFERGLEGLDEAVGQVADEADGVGESSGWPSGSSMRRVVVSRVAKSMSLAITSAPLRRLSRVDLPALV